MVPGGQFDSSLTRVQPFFTSLVARDRSGRSWLPALLGATPHGRAVLGDTLDAAEPLLEALMRPAGGVRRLRCFEYPVPPPRSLLRWFVEHPDELVWPAAAVYSPETTLLRKALVHDDPAGSRAPAQAEARRLLERCSPMARGWWRFEGTSMLDCVLMTPRLVVTVEGKRSESLSSATDWYPKRSQLVRNLEAAKEMAQGRRWASLVISERPLAEGSDEGLSDVLDQSTPHLHEACRQQLTAAYLGNITWREACAAVDLEFATLPATVGEVRDLPMSVREKRG